jgi:hypothetical protein
VLTEVPVTMREREHGCRRSRRSVIFHGQILLALFVGLFRRKVTPMENA